MSEQNPYQKLGVSEEATFEEIQNARDRLVATSNQDENARESIEAAYDAVLMDRLRQRQEGKIKVPEGIRFAERLSEAPPNVNLPTINQSPSWLKGLLDTPSRQDVLLPALSFAVLGSGSVFLQQSQDTLALLLALGFGFTLYFLNRKENKLGRSLMLTLSSLVVGGIIGGLVQANLPLQGVSPDSVVSVAIFILFWAVSSFLR